MSEKNPTVFHIANSKSIPVVIHPFGEAERVAEYPPDREIIGQYGSDPPVEAMTLIRNELYSVIDTEVKEAMAEKRFFPRFLISLGVFFITFFATAFIIRDVIPLIDEMILAAGAAVTVYLVIQRRDQVSKPALELKILLKKRIDRISFSQSPLLLLIEQLFQRSEQVEGNAAPDVMASDLNQYLKSIWELLDSEGESTETLELMRDNLDLASRRKKAIESRIHGKNGGRLDELKKLESSELLYALIILILGRTQIHDSVQTQ